MSKDQELEIVSNNRITIVDLGEANSLDEALDICDRACGIEAGDGSEDESPEYFVWSKLRDWLLELRDYQEAFSKIKEATEYLR